ncbi:MAG: GNAT family N-acetyltransferase, partial [Nocardioides sp.]
DDEDLMRLADLAARGVHDPDRMPFGVPWTEVPAGELPRRFAQHHWMLRGSLTPDNWSLQLGVWRSGEPLGVQALHARDFPVARSAGTGSWLGRDHQGMGVGTQMRRAVCAFAFDYLGAEEITSGAWLDNPASLAVSRKVGYQANGVRRLRRRTGEVAEHQDLLLTRATFVAPEAPIEVVGAEGLRALLGLDT